MHRCVLECTMMTNVFPKSSGLELIYLRTPSSCTSDPSNPGIRSHVSMLEGWYWWEPKLPQVHPWMCCGIWPVAECIPADRHSHKTCSVRGPLCRLPALSRAQESSLASVFAAIPHQRSPLQTRQNNLPFSFSVAHTHTHTDSTDRAILVWLKQPSPHWLGIFFFRVLG